MVGVAGVGVGGASASPVVVGAAVGTEGFLEGR